MQMVSHYLWLWLSVSSVDRRRRGVHAYRVSSILSDVLRVIYVAESWKSKESGARPFSGKTDDFFGGVFN